MLQRDYVLELIGQFTEVVKRALKRAQMGDLGGCEEVERQIGEILDLEYGTALSLAPDSLVTMMVISGMGDSVASYVCFALARLAEVYEKMGNEDLSMLRAAQAKAVAESFGCDPDDVPEELR